MMEEIKNIRFTYQSGSFNKSPFEVDRRRDRIARGSSAREPASSAL
jgi:hypothetical protein